MRHVVAFAAGFAVTVGGAATGMEVAVAALFGAAAVVAAEEMAAAPVPVAA